MNQNKNDPVPVTEDTLEGDTVIPMRLLTPDDYLYAARLVAKCEASRLPIILSLLSSGGWDIPTIRTQQPPEADTSDIGERIRSIREKTGITLQQLSTESGISVEVLRGYENGRRYPKQARYQQLVLLLDRLGEQEGTP